MDRTPPEPEIVLSEPYNPEHGATPVVYLTSRAIKKLLTRWKATHLRLVVPPYEEVVMANDMPTNDFVDAVRHDVESHGRLVVTIHPHPEPEGYDPQRDFEMVCTMAGQTPDGIELRVILFDESLLKEVQKVAHAAVEDSDESD